MAEILHLDSDSRRRLAEVWPFARLFQALRWWNRAAEKASEEVWGESDSPLLLPPQELTPRSLTSTIWEPGTQALSRKKRNIIQVSIL